MLICLDRYIAVAYPLKYMRTMSPRRCKVILATFSIVVRLGKIRLICLKAVFSLFTVMNEIMYNYACKPISYP